MSKYYKVVCEVRAGGEIENVYPSLSAAKAVFSSWLSLHMGLGNQVSLAMFSCHPEGVLMITDSCVCTFDYDGDECA